MLSSEDFATTVLDATTTGTSEPESNWSCSSIKCLQRNNVFTRVLNFHLMNLVCSYSSLRARCRKHWDQGRMLIPKLFYVDEGPNLRPRSRIIDRMRINIGSLK